MNFLLFSTAVILGLLVGTCLLYKLSTKKIWYDANPDSPFQKGDKVTAFGNIGEVKSISENGMFVIVKFPEFDSTVVFRTNGKLTSWHKNVSLTKI